MSLERFEGHWLSKTCIGQAKYGCIHNVTTFKGVINIQKELIMSFPTPHYKLLINH